jgi:uncharacterized protein (DUF1501 family)
MMFKRRHLLQGLGAGTLGLLSPAARLFAAPAGASERSRFLLVFLRGGYDAANLLVPISSSHYYEQRPRIAIARPGDGAETALSLNDNADWALHPALRESVYPLLQSGQAVFIPFAGAEDLSRSHFETQDSIELGQDLSGTRDFQSGFMNRLAAELGARQAISFTDQLPMCFRGPAKIGNAALRDGRRPVLDAKQRALLSGMYREQALSQQVEEGFALRDEVARELSPARMQQLDQASRNPIINAKGFELESRRIARLLRGGRYQLGFVDVGGWDTHVGQGGATGQLATRFEELGRGLAGFAEELGPAAWQQTTVMVISEFGRTFRENGNRGTDHGHGSVYWLLGGGLARHGVAGEQIALNAQTLNQGRDYPVLSDYRRLLAGLWRRQYGLSDAALARIFPRSGATLDLGLV